MRIILSLIFSFLLTGCSERNLESEYRPSPTSRLVREISNIVFNQLITEKKLCPIECGGGGKDQIKLLHWGFFCYREIDINDARELLITIGNQFLNAFNSDERIRPYLATYPFKPENIEVRIFFKQPNGAELEPEKIHVISIFQGKLNYMIESSETGTLKEIHSETYEEAAEKLGLVFAKS